MIHEPAGVQESFSETGSFIHNFYWDVISSPFCGLPTACSLNSFRRYVFSVPLEMMHITESHPHLDMPWWQFRVDQLITGNVGTKHAH